VPKLVGNLVISNGNKIVFILNII